MKSQDDKVNGTDEDLPSEEEYVEHLAEEEKQKKEGAAKTKGDVIREGLLSGMSVDELIAQGMNPGSIRIIALELEKTGRWKRPAKQKAVTTQQPEKKLQVYAKGSPPEAIIDNIHVPIEHPDGFESGIKFGMSMVVAGIRMAQELSGIGVQQARPLIDMAKDMRSGEAAAARSAAMEAAASAAEHVQAGMIPYLTQMDTRLSHIERPPSENPFRDMMMRMMEPVMQNMFKSIMPGMQQGNQEPQGWSRREE